MLLNINVREANLETATTDGFPTIQTGWYKLVLSEVSEEREEKSGSGFGALFTFKIVEGECADMVFKKWYCVQAKTSQARWRQQQFENIVTRIAMCVGVDVVNSVDQVMDKPFYAYVVASEREYESKEVDRDGNFVMKTTTDVDFGKGRILDNIISCADYSKEQERKELALEMPF